MERKICNHIEYPLFITLIRKFSTEKNFFTFKEIEQKDEQKKKIEFKKEPLKNKDKQRFNFIRWISNVKRLKNYELKIGLDMFANYSAFFFVILILSTFALRLTDECENEKCESLFSLHCQQLHNQNNYEINFCGETKP